MIKMGCCFSGLLVIRNNLNVAILVTYRGRKRALGAGRTGRYDIAPQDKVKLWVMEGEELVCSQEFTVPCCVRYELSVDEGSLKILRAAKQKEELERKLAE